MISKGFVVLASSSFLWLAWAMLLFCRAWQDPDRLFARHLSLICPHKYHMLVFGTNTNHSLAKC